MNPFLCLLFLFLACATQDPAPEPLPAGIPEGYSLLYSQDFAGPESRSDFVFSDPSAWKVDRGSLALTKPSVYQPPVRSPRNLALIRGKSFGSFVLEAEIQSTGREYGHLDMCLFFGVQSRDHLYYAHVAQAADDHAHNLFRVDATPRIKFASRTSKGIRWGKGQWHKLRLVRDVASGRVELYFDDMETPVMVGEDRRFLRGQIGFGSFDDTGRVRKIRIWGQKTGKERGTDGGKGSKASDLGFASDPDEVQVFLEKGRARITLGGKLFTEYRWTGKLGPFFAPVLLEGALPMTRAWPVDKARKGEAKDHPHHRSLWLAHGDINGLDFWSGQDGSHVVQTSIRRLAPGGKTQGETPGKTQGIQTRNDWLDGQGRLVCRDERTMTFGQVGQNRILDLDIRVQASEGPLHFGETKEGTMAIRMNPRLRLRGKVAKGQALNSEGVTGAAVWGKRARWVAYQAPLLPKDRKNPKKQLMAGLALFDHPDNLGYPCHWHARDYGLLAANPFGSQSFGGKQSKGFTLAKGKTLRLRYRFVFFHGAAKKATLDLSFRRFVKVH